MVDANGKVGNNSR